MEKTLKKDPKQRRGHMWLRPNHDLLTCSPRVLLGTLSKERRRRQRERHKTKGLMNRKMAVHVRFKFL